MSEEEIILKNLPLIHQSIKQLKVYWKNEEEWQDYYGSGLIGLVIGAKTYDESKGYKFSTYLMPCINNAIKKQMAINTTARRGYGVVKAASINIEVGDEGSELADFIVDNRVNIEKEVERKILFETIIDILNNMDNQKDALAVKMHYGLDGYPDMKLREIAEVFGVSMNMITIRLNRALDILRREINR